MDITCISDLHGHYPELEGGDLLIVAGDWTAHDTFEELEKFEKDYLRFQNYKKIILVAGNHDNIAQKCEWVSRGKITYLCDSGTEFEGFKIWGSPWTAYFEGMNPDCMAFTLNFGCDTEEKLAEKWAMIPDDVDILITHSPPYGLLDLIKQMSFSEAEDISKGSFSLQKRWLELKPKLHVFGHIHECGGTALRIGSSIIVNASHVNERYEPVNKPIRIIM